VDSLNVEPQTNLLWFDRNKGNNYGLIAKTKALVPLIKIAKKAA